MIEGFAAFRRVATLDLLPTITDGPSVTSPVNFLVSNSQFFSTFSIKDVIVSEFALMCFFLYILTWKEKSFYFSCVLAEVFCIKSNNGSSFFYLQWILSLENMLMKTPSVRHWILLLSFSSLLDENKKLQEAFQFLLLHYVVCICCVCSMHPL